MTCHYLSQSHIRVCRTSLNLDNYLEANHVELAKLEELVAKILDISDCRVMFGLRKIADMSLVEIPGENEQWTTDMFVEKTEARCVAMIQAINTRQNLIQVAVRDMLAVVSADLSEAQRREISPAFEAVYAFYNAQNFEALVQTTKASLDGRGFRAVSFSWLYSFLPGAAVKARLVGTGGAVQYNKSAQRPFFRTELMLSIPNVVLQPRLEDIQSALNRVSNAVLDVSKKVTNWKPFVSSGDDVADATASRADDGSQVAMNKDVAKVVAMLSSTVNSIKKDVESHREQFGKYDSIWRDDKTDVIKAFLASNPTISDFESEINRFEYVEREVAEIPNQSQISMLLVSAEPLKLALTTETKLWKQSYGSNLNSKVKKDMEEMMVRRFFACSQYVRIYDTWYANTHRRH